MILESKIENRMEILMISILCGHTFEILKTLQSDSVHCVVTSPPYWGLRDYGVDGQIGLEKSPDDYVLKIVDVFREVRRVLRKDGTLWLNLGDSYNNNRTGGHGATGGADKSTLQSPGHRGASPIRKSIDPLLKSKDLVGIPWRVAFALQADGWFLRSDIIWAKPNPMPESVRDRPTRAHEYLFLLSKSKKYFYDVEAIKEPGIAVSTTKMPDGWDSGPGTHGTFHQKGREKGKRIEKQRGHSIRHAGFNNRWDKMDKSEQCSMMRNKRSVWNIPTEPFPEAHFATFPTALVEPCIKAGCPSRGVVLDPFAGAGTTGLVADRLGRNAILIELNPSYVSMTKLRLEKDAGMFAQVEVAQ